MTILLSTSNNIKGGENFKIPLIEQIEGELHNYASHITRVEGHLTDENGDKQGKDDKKCVLEAHVPHVNPVVVTAHADTYEQAVDAALDKLKSALHKVMDKAKAH